MAIIILLICSTAMVFLFFLFSKNISFTIRSVLFGLLYFFAIVVVQTGLSFLALNLNQSHLSASFLLLLLLTVVLPEQGVKYLLYRQAMARKIVTFPTIFYHMQFLLTMATVFALLENFLYLADSFNVYHQLVLRFFTALPVHLLTSLCFILVKKFALGVAITIHLIYDFMAYQPSTLKLLAIPFILVIALIFMLKIVEMSKKSGKPETISFFK